jgi:hypothetical protein
MTRDRFICTDINATAPGRSSLGTSVGRIALRPGAPIALAMPIANTSTAIVTRDGSTANATAASPNDNNPCATCALTRKRRRSTASASRPPHRERNRSGPS